MPPTPTTRCLSEITVWATPDRVCVIRDLVDVQWLGQDDAGRRVLVPLTASALCVVLRNGLGRTLRSQLFWPTADAIEPALRTAEAWRVDNAYSTYIR